MRKTTALIFVLLLGSVTLASAADFSGETTQETKPIYCTGSIGLLATLLGASCGPDWEATNSTLSGEEKKTDAPDGDPTETKYVRRVGDR